MKILVTALRICAGLALVLGVLSWLGVTYSFIMVHMALGILTTALLWAIGVVAGARSPRNLGLALAAIVLGLVMVYVGWNQRSLLVGSLHWVIQVVHLLLGVLAVGLGSIIAGRYAASEPVSAA